MLKILISFPPRDRHTGTVQMFRRTSRALLCVLAVSAAAAAAPTDSIIKTAPEDSIVPEDTAAETEIQSDSGTAAPRSDSSAPSTAKMTRIRTKDTTKTVVSDSFDVRTGSIIGGGIGLSIGGIQVIELWKNGLQQSLTDFRLTDSSFNKFKLPNGDSDTLKVAFNIKQAPDVYNMTFPLTVSFGRLFQTHRYEVAVSFTTLSKNSQSSISIGADSVGRRIDISQSMGLYAITFDFLYGTGIPIRYFSIDGADRTDLIAGVSITPFVGLSKTTSINAPDSASDPRLWALRNSILSRLNSVSASGIAFGWRLGIAKLRHLSKNGAIEGRICYCGMWSTHFGTLTENEISAKSGDPGRSVSYFSSRFEVSFSLVRKL